MIRLVPVEKKDRELFWNINQKYLYEMTMYYPDAMDSNGNLHYGYFDEYFTDTQRKAFFIFNNEIMVGFVMINPYSVINHNPDYTMAEFTIFPTYRRNRLAMEAVELIFSMYHGKWEIKYNEKNKAARELWTKVTAVYKPSVFHLNEVETVLEFTN